MSDTVIAEVEDPDVEDPDTEDEDGGDVEEQDGDQAEAELAAPEQVTMSGITPDEVERRFGAVRRSWGTYKGVITRQLDFLEGRLEECPMCKEDHPGYIDLHDAGKYPEAVSTAVMQFLGFATEIAYLQDPDTGTCQRCGGEGLVKTGSKVKTALRKECPACHGYGFQPPPGDDQTVKPMSVAPIQPVTDQVAAINNENTDAWGEPRILPDGRENPNFGKMPQFKIPVQPWGVTAGLTAQHAVESAA